MNHCYKIMTDYVKVNIDYDTTLRKVVILNSSVNIDKSKKININVANLIKISNVDELIYDTSDFECIKIYLHNTTVIKINKNGDIKL